MSTPDIEKDKIENTVAVMDQAVNANTDENKELTDEQLKDVAGGVGFHSIEKFTPLSTVIKNSLDLDFQKKNNKE